MSTSYDDLIADVPAFLEDDGTELSASLDRFMTLMQARVFKDLFPLPCFRGSATGTLTINDQSLTIATTMRKVRNFYITVSGEKFYLDNRNESYLNDYWPVAATTAQPKMFAVVSSAPSSTVFRVAGTPASGYSYRIEYASPLTALATGNQTNWLTQNAEDTLLYGMLIEAATFLKHKEGIDMYSAMYAQSLAKFDIDRLMAEWNSGA